MYSSAQSEKSEHLYASVHGGKSVSTGYRYPQEKYGNQVQPTQQQYPSLVLGPRGFAGYPPSNPGSQPGYSPQYPGQGMLDNRCVSNLYTVSTFLKKLDYCVKKDDAKVNFSTDQYRAAKYVVFYSKYLEEELLQPLRCNSFSYSFMFFTFWF